MAPGGSWGKKREGSEEVIVGTSSSRSSCGHLWVVLQGCLRVVPTRGTVLPVEGFSCNVSVDALPACSVHREVQPCGEQMPLREWQVLCEDPGVGTARGYV